MTREVKRMKKLMSVVLTGAMIWMLGLQCLAAGSVTNVTDAATVTSSAGSVSWDEISDGSVSEDQMEVVNAVSNAGTGSSVSDALGSLIDLNAVKLFDTDSAYLEDVKGLFENMNFLSEARMLSFTDVVPSEASPVKVTFTANNMTSSMNVYVLYNCPVHGWELLETTRTSDNQVTASFHSGPGVAILVYTDDGANADNAAGTSPKMGEGNSTIYMSIAVVMLLAFGCYAVMRSRKRA
jgi:hypothetical protein